jgi:primary-amine oxidase
MPAYASKSSPHPLDPLTVDEVQTVAQTVQKDIGYTVNDIRFKVIDLAEPPKALTLQYLRHNGPAPDRKARVYYHRKRSQSLLVAIVNISKRRIEKNYDCPDSQGPVDWDEFELVNRACNNHPEVKAEVAKLKLPPK